MPTKHPPLFVMCMTPFTSDDRIDEAALLRHWEYMLPNNIGIFLGSPNTSEGHLLTHEERKQVYRLGLKEIKQANRGKVYATPLGPGNTKQMLAAFKEAREMGLDGAQLYLAAPYAGGIITEREAEHYYRDVLDAVRDWPLFVCNYFPGGASVGKAGGRVPTALLKRLVDDYPQIAGINMVADLEYARTVIEGVGKRVEIRGAGGGQLFEHLEMGGHGFISHEPNIAPKLCNSIVELHQKGDKKGAKERFDLMMKLRVQMNKYVFPASVKGMLNHLGFRVGTPRLPHLPLEPGAQREAGALLDEINIKGIEGIR